MGLRKQYNGVPAIPPPTSPLPVDAGDVVLLQHLPVPSVHGGSRENSYIYSRPRPPVGRGAHSRAPRARARRRVGRRKYLYKLTMLRIRIRGPAPGSLHAADADALRAVRLRTTTQPSARSCPHCVAPAASTGPREWTDECVRTARRNDLDDAYWWTGAEPANPCMVGYCGRETWQRRQWPRDDSLALSSGQGRWYW